MQRTQDSKRREKMGDRLAAGLALANQRRAPAGPCLDARQLAELVDGQLSATVRTQALAHIADCEQCYRAWRAVAEACPGRRGQERSGWQRLWNPRLLTGIGYGLAIAASVVVFLQLQHGGIQRLETPESMPAARQSVPDVQHNEMGKPMEHSRKQPDPRPEASPSAAPEPPVTKSIQEMKTPAKPAESQRVERKNLPTQAPREKTAQPQALQQPAPAAPAAGPAVKARPQSAATKEQADGTLSSSYQAENPLAAWWQEVLHSCRLPRHDLARWQQLHQQGQNLLAQLPAAGASEEMRKTLVAMAALHSEADIARLCAGIDSSAAPGLPRP